MESLAALSLASSVVQFVDFGCRCFSESKELYRSMEGASEAQLEIGDVTEKLQGLALGLEADEETLPKSLVAMAGRCRALASELLAKLDMDKVESTTSNGKKRKRDVAKQVIKNKWNRRDRNAVARRLADLRSQLILELLVVISNSISKYDPDSTKRKFQDTALKELISEDQEIGQRLQIPSILDQLQATVRHRDSSSIDLSDVQQRLDCAVHKEEQLEVVRQVLKSLQFPSLSRRREAIHQAYKNTYGWVVAPDGSSSTEATAFRRWLGKGKDIFWVTGIPGSGKSTLIKLLSQQARNSEILINRFRDKRLVVADFYFWKPGDSYQQTQGGLLRALLYQIFEACPELVSETVPEALRYNKYSDSSEWNLEHLLETIQKISLKTIKSTQFCFFIDGLDEYDITGSNNYHDLATCIKTLAASRNVLICVSSRPYNVFMKYFGQQPELVLRLHEFTKRDINTYVDQRFKAHPKCDEVLSDRFYYNKLKTDIVERAQGVFLWVVLVVKSLLSGMDGDDSIIVLQKRLDATPGELEDLFCQMIRSTDPIYRADAVRIYRCILSMPNITVFSFVLGISLDRSLRSRLDAAFNSHRRTDAAKLVEACDSVVRARCKDLVHFIPTRCSLDWVANIAPVYEVEFIHRTVFDFLKESDWEPMLLGDRRLVFEPLLCIGMATVDAAIIYHSSGSRFVRILMEIWAEIHAKLRNELPFYASVEKPDYGSDSLWSEDWSRFKPSLEKYRLDVQNQLSQYREAMARKEGHTHVPKLTYEDLINGFLLRTNRRV